MPRYSILIPTRCRHDTLRYSLETVVAQRFPDYEVVIANNNHDKDTSDVINSFREQNYPVREVYSDRMLSMSENWEMGLDACKGEYVTVLGDDDGFLPETLSYAEYVLRSTNSKLLNWSYHEYFWPGTSSERSQNHLVVSYARNENIVTRNSYHKLREMYCFSEGFNTYPMIYNGVVHRDVISAVKKKCGMYFACDIPDVFSAVANLHFTESFVAINRPLAVRGTSKHSNGNAMNASREKGEAALQQFQKEAGKQGRGLHPLVFESSLIGIVVAGTFLVARDALFPNDSELKVDIRTVLNIMAGTAARTYDLYDLSVEHMHRLAAMHGIPQSDYIIPPRPPVPAPNAVIGTGPVYGADGTLDSLVINGALCGLRTISDATRLVSALTPLPLV